MNTQKTYLGKTSGQWLQQAVVCDSQAGCKEIFVDDGVIAAYHPDGMLIKSSSGPIALLALSVIQNQKFRELCEVRDSNE